VKKYQMCPMTTPIISSLGTFPCIMRLKPISTHGKYGAVKTRTPKKLSCVSGFFRDQIYTRVEESGCPRKGRDTRGDMAMRLTIA